MSTSERTTTRATGTFEIDSWSDEEYGTGERSRFGRAWLTKIFAGDLVGTSAVEMLGVSLPVEGSEKFQGAAYVAVEHVTGTLHGRAGDFALVHAAGEAHGTTVAVVPGSASGGLRGLTGQLTITRHEDGSHEYAFDYALGDQALG